MMATKKASTTDTRPAAERPQRPGDAVRAGRLRGQLSQVELAIRAGVHPSTVSLVERGVAASDETIEKLAAALGMRPEELRA